MAKVSIPRPKEFVPVTLALETKEELQELVEELGGGTGPLLQDAFDELKDYLETL